MDLKTQLQRLDEALDRGLPEPACSALRATLKVARIEAPEMVGRLLQHVSVRGVLAEIPAPLLNVAMGRPPVHDAYFWRLLARAYEARGILSLVCLAWEQFRVHALAEDWFDAGSLEAAAVDLRTASMLAPFDAEKLAVIRATGSGAVRILREFYKNQPEPIRALAPTPGDPVNLDPGRLYERAAQGGGGAQAFRPWLSWARRHLTWREADQVARRWSEACLGDSEPLLALAAAAERRGCLEEARDFLARAGELAAPAWEKGSGDSSEDSWEGEMDFDPLCSCAQCLGRREASIDMVWLEVDPAMPLASLIAEEPHLC